MSEPASISASIAGRYATAVFDLAKEANDLAALEADVAALDAALKDSAEFRSLISSAVYSREEQGRAIGALAERMGLTPVVSNTLKLMASKRRLFALPQLVASLSEAIAAHKGEVTAEVTTAVPLSDAQWTQLSSVISEKVGKAVKLIVTIDDRLIGGLVVKVGSKMIDTSIRTKLATLQNAMKEV